MDDRVAKVAGAAPRALRELAASLRRAIEAMLVNGDSSEDLVWARERVDEVAARLARRDQADPARERPFYVEIPASWGHNPVVPLLEMESEGGVTRATVRFGVAYEGPPGCVHSGFVAWLFDQVMGHNNVMAGLPAVTGSLTVRFRKPTPLFTELRIEARVKKARGRAVQAKGKLWAGDVLTADAEGLFVRGRV